MSDEKLLIVVKLGSMNIYGGISGNDAPTAVSLNLIEEDEATVSKDGPKKYRNPFASGVLEQPKDFELLIRSVVGNDFDPKKEASGILICDMPRHTAKERAMMCEVLFDVMEFPAVNFYYRPPLAAMACGRVTCLVVEMSDNGVVVAPVVDAQMLRDKTIMNNKLAGKRLTDQLLVPAIAAANGGTKVVEKFTNTDRILLKRFCKVAPSAAAYEALSKDPAATKPSTETFVLHRFVKDDAGKEWKEPLYPSEAALSKVPEALFNPALLGDKDEPGLAEVIVKALTESDVALAGAIVLAGRGSLFPGLAQRLERDVSALLSAMGHAVTVDIVADDTRAQGAWIGGSILTSMRSVEDNNFVTKATWSQYGAALFESGWLSS